MKKSLQKFTSTRKKIEYLYSLDQITFKDIHEILNGDEIKIFYNEMTQKSKDLKGKEYDMFWHKVDKIIHQETKNSLWEYNHSQITAYLSDFIHENGRMPHNSELAARTGLSRQTIHKHLKEYQDSSLFDEQQKQLLFLREKVLAKMFSFGVKGNIKAARLFLECTSGMNEKKLNVTNNTQNNFIQINGTILTQDFINGLSSDVLQVIQRELMKNDEVVRPQ
jgi:hypothetical protein